MLQNIGELEPAFAAIEKQRPDAMIVQPSLGLGQVAQLALKYRVPTLCPLRSFVDEGGLMSYWFAEADLYRHAAIIVDKILKGAKLADLPVEQPTKFELVINLKTANTLGLTIPRTLLGRADEIIE